MLSLLTKTVKVYERDCETTDMLTVWMEETYSSGIDKRPGRPGRCGQEEINNTTTGRATACDRQEDGIDWELEKWKRST